VNQRTSIFLVGFVALGLFGAAMAGPLEDGDAALKKGDYATALQILRPLADHGNAAAQYEIAGMYSHGQGVRQDYTRAAAWYRKAADQGNAGAQFNLGEMYANAKGVPQDYVFAHMWFNLAAARTEIPVQRLFLAKKRDEVAAKMTPDQIAEAQRLALEWEPK
jgi:uncharacterized protein